MTLVANIVRTVPSMRFICCCWRNPWCDFHATHTPQCNDPPKIRANNLNNTYSFSLCRLKITTELGSGTVDKLTGIFTKRIW